MGIVTRTESVESTVKRFAVYNRWESEEATIYSVFLSGEIFRQPRCKPNWITAKILDINQMKGYFSSAVLDKKSNTDGAYLSFEAISKELIESLNSRTRLNCILSNPIIHRRTRKKFLLPRPFNNFSLKPTMC